MQGSGLCRKKPRVPLRVRLPTYVFFFVYNSLLCHGNAVFLAVSTLYRHPEAGTQEAWIFRGEAH